MKIDYFQINKFRNLNFLEYQPTDGLNIFAGDNGQGKTNILEAIFFLATGTSFRTNRYPDLIAYNSPGLNIKARYQIKERIIDAHINYDPINGKTFKLNTKKVNPKHTDRLKIVLFSPDDLYLVKGSPSKRRDFLDFILAQISSDYLNCYNNFSKILKKRNLFLKKANNDFDKIFILDEIFIEYAAKMLITRINFIYLFDQTAREVYAVLNNNAHNLKIRYALSFPADSGKINLDLLKDLLKKQLSEKREYEIKRKTSLIGPHLDDIHIYLDNKLARSFASQGQQRNIAVCLKLAELLSFKKVKGFYPIFLLDEVLAELDQNSKSRLLDFIINSDFQSFLSSVKLDNIDSINASVAVVKNGCLLRKE